jgi:poly-gamma-glutamate synthesis protein (capsule biosynthesis protein)
MSKITCIATGDYLQTRRIPAGDPDFPKIRSIITGADARITNLEITISYQEGTPNGYSGGTHLWTPPDRLDDLKAYGFNLVSAANNHCLDYGEDGLKITMGYLRQYGISYAGIGMNKAEAARPVYLDTAGGRVALLSVTSSLVKPWYPEEQRRDMIGRPGANGLRCFNDIRLSAEQYQVLTAIKEGTSLNNLVDMMVEQGFVNLPEGMIPFGFDIYGFPWLFRQAQTGEEPGLSTYPNAADMEHLARDVQSAKLAADCVVVNLHGHEMKTNDPSVPADFHGIAAKGLIDAGADAVVIQGSHQTRGIEVYKGKPIFYGLGNFVFQDSTLTAVPQAYYDEQATDGQETFNQIVQRLAQNPQYLMSNPLVMTSVFAGWEIEDGKITAITLYPIDLHAEKPLYNNGFPVLSNDEAILDRVIARSEPYGTVISKETVTLEDGSQTLVGKVLI